MDLARFTAGDVEAASGTYGGHVRARPRAVVRPRSVDEVLELIRIARGAGLAIGARGQGHSTGGQPLVPDGLVVETGELAQIGEIDDGAVWVGAGATWRQVVAATLPRGLAPPVLNDYLGLSVGGTLSVGGVGMASFRHGAQVDQVRELDVVTGAGELIRCSAVRERGLFDAVRAGQGQVGIIVAARLAVTPAPTHVEVRKVHLRDGGMTEPCGRTSLEQKALAPFRIGGQFRRKDLYGDRPLELKIVRPVNNTHASLTNDAINAVMAQGLANQRR